MLILYKMVSAELGVFLNPFHALLTMAAHSRVTAAGWEWSADPCPLPKAAPGVFSRLSKKEGAPTVIWAWGKNERRQRITGKKEE